MLRLYKIYNSRSGGNGGRGGGGEKLFAEHKFRPNFQSSMFAMTEKLIKFDAERPDNKNTDDLFTHALATG